MHHMTPPLHSISPNADTVVSSTYSLSGLIVALMPTPNFSTRSRFKSGRTWSGCTAPKFQSSSSRWRRLSGFGLSLRDQSDGSRWKEEADMSEEEMVGQDLDERRQKSSLWWWRPWIWWGKPHPLLRDPTSTHHPHHFLSPYAGIDDGELQSSKILLWLGASSVLWSQASKEDGLAGTGLGMGLPAGFCFLSISKGGHCTKSGNAD